MAEPRKVQFVTLSSFNTSPPTQESSKKRRREDEAVTHGKDGGGGAAAVGSGGGGGGLFGNAKGGDAAAEDGKPTVRLCLSLSEPNERGSSEFNYGELVQPSPQVKVPGSSVPKGLAPPLDPSDPFADDEKERREVEELARKFENKYGGAVKKKKKDRMQDLIDIGYGYDETDPFIDNSEAYDELVPASLTTKHGGFYINTGTLQFRAASDSEGENEDHFKKVKDGEERAIKKRRKKQDGGILEEKKPRKNKVPKTGVLVLNRPEKKKRKKLMKDSLHLANMLRRFTREKEEMRKKNMVVAGTLNRPNAKVPISANSTLLTANTKAASGNDCNMTDLADDQAVMSLLGAANNDLLQDMMGDLDFSMLDSPQPCSPAQGENGSFGAGHKLAAGRPAQGSMMTPPPLPSGLPGPLTKRIEDLRAASRLFDEEGRKKFFTLDMNNILLDIELQVQEQPVEVRAAVYSHLEAFVPCNKEALLKRLKKLSLNIQDDRLRNPLLKLKLAVCSVMPEQIARYNMDCIAKVAKHQSEEGEKNGSEDDDEEKPGKRVMGPRKKFVWDDKLRTLLCNLVRVKLGCYELEGKTSVSLEDYLKAFMETEVKPLWPKGWMQARMLFKESTMVHGHLTGYTAKKKMVTTPKARPKEAAWVQRPTPSAAATPSPAAPVAKRLPQSPAEPICLDSLDEAPSLDSISQALAILGNAAKGLAQGDSPPSPERPKAAAIPPTLLASPLLQQQKKTPVSTPASSAPHYISTSSSSSSSLSRPPSGTSSPLTSVRVEAMGVLKGAASQVHRHPVLNTQRPLSVAVTKASMPVSQATPKPRPPPTASPLVAPGLKVGISTPPSSLLKGSNNKANSDAIIITSSQSRPLTIQSPAANVSKTFQAPRLAMTPQSKSSPSLTQTLPGAQPQPQSNFITPMHATLTKSTHSSIPPIVRLTPRTQNAAITTATTSAATSVSLTPRSQAAPPIHQYPPKTLAGYRLPFSGSTGGAAKQGPGSYSSPSSQKTPSINSSTNTSLINTSSISKHSGTSASPAVASAAPGWKLTLAVLVLLVSTHADALFSRHMKDFIKAVQQVEDENPELEAVEVLRMLRRAGGLNDAFVQHFLPDADSSHPELDADLSDYLRRAVQHRVLEGAREEGVVLTPDGMTVAVGPLLLGIEAGFLSSTPGRVPGLYQLTLARDLGASIRRRSDNSQPLATDGCWDNLTSPQVFTLSDAASTLTTAQVHGAMDGVILGKEVSAKPGESMKLSSLLTDYYLHQLDARGMDGAPRLISRRRRELFKTLVAPPVLVRQVAKSLELQEKLQGRLKMELQQKRRLMAAVKESMKEFVHMFMECPPIVARCTWGAAPYIGTPTILSLPLTYLFIHHTASPSQPCLTFEQCSADMRSMQRYHQESNGWDDIGYSFVAGSDGNIYEGRGWKWQGAHTGGYNSKGYGVSFIGDYSNTLPSQNSMALVRDQLASCAVGGGQLVSSYILKGHRQMVSTSCPGNTFYQEITTWGHYQP